MCLICLVDINTKFDGLQNIKMWTHGMWLPLVVFIQLLKAFYGRKMISRDSWVWKIFLSQIWKSLRGLTLSCGNGKSDVVWGVTVIWNTLRGRDLDIFRKDKLLIINFSGYYNTVVRYLFRHEVGFQENTRKEELNNGGVKISLSCSFTLFLKKYYKCCECFCFVFCFSFFQS